jgi:riboflavin kinase/FMN adenylyltransferase
MMDVIRGNEPIPAGLRGAVVTIGNFDGVHLGHQHIFAKLTAAARRAKCPAVVISFDPHPKSVLHPERRPFYLLTTPEEKIRLISEQGIDALLLLPFSLDYARTPAERFVRDVLWDALRIRKIFIGHDYTFGRDRQGNEVFLKTLGEKLGFEVEVMSAFKANGAAISSTRIRKAILGGEVSLAASLLGRAYNLTGRVIAGNRRGVKLGFPTANLAPAKELIPPRGIYAVRARYGEKLLQGVLNIGFNPTFEGRQISIEVHLLDFAANLYGQTIEILFVERLRDEIRFASPEALIAQIQRDIMQARELLLARG